jgi:hypothetical protein
MAARVRHFYGAFTSIGSVLTRRLFSAAQIGGMKALLIMAVVYWFCAGVYLATHFLDVFVSRLGQV